MSVLDEVVQRVWGKQLANEMSLKDEDIASALDRRDESRFSEEWMSAFNAIEQLKAAHRQCDEVQARMEALREAAYLQSFARWQSPDLAAYMSDDIGLVGNAVSLNYSSPFWEHLATGYMRGEFPMAPI